MPKIACLLLLAAFYSCKPAPRSDKPVIKNGDVEIAYTLSGNGDTAILFVHGWCIDRSYWEQQEQYFNKRFTVVAPDLGGHGQSGTNRTNWTVEAYAKDVEAVINGLKLEKVILVGHSMGGDIVLQTTLDMPAKIIGFVGVDNFKEFADSFTTAQRNEMNAFVQQLSGNFDSTASNYGRQYLFPQAYSDTAAVNRVLRSIQAADSVMAIRSLQSLMEYTLLEPKKLAQLQLPAHLIVSDYTPVDEEKLKTYARAGYSIAVVPGVGHYPMIEKPALFNQLLENAITQIATAK